MAGPAQILCLSVAEWVVRLVLSQSHQPQPETQGGCAGGQLCWWYTLVCIGAAGHHVPHGRTHAHSSPNKARLAYAIAADYGCVWDMKFCPSGAWEPPTTARTVSAAQGLPLGSSRVLRGDSLSEPICPSPAPTDEPAGPAGHRLLRWQGGGVCPATPWGPAPRQDNPGKR